MERSQYAIDSRMIPPVILGAVFGLLLIAFEVHRPRALGPTIIILLPFFYLGAEILARKIVLDAAGVTVHKLLRSVRLGWAEIESLDVVKSGSKLFLVLQGATDIPVIITNTIRPFSALVADLQARLPQTVISRDVLELSSNMPEKHAHLIQAWLVCFVLAGVVAGRVMGY
ncbi:MAG: PH domain-containing protein [Pseudomonadota bacterium]